MKSHSTFPTIIITFISAAFFSGCAMIPLDTGMSETTSFDTQEAAQLLHEERLERARRAHQIAVGMEMRDVASIWGQPSEVQLAGSSGEGNQKWVYFDGLSARWSLSTAREIFFEDGRVVGWRTVANR